MHSLAFGIGTQEILLILAIAFLLFGAAKLPKLGSAIGEGIRNFKRGMREVHAEEEEAQKLEAQKLEAKKEEAKKLEAQNSNADQKNKDE